MLGLLVLGLAATGCGRDDPTADPTAGPIAAPGAPVVLISIDTLRADRLPAYGYEEVATPAIDRLRNDSILFERAWSHIPLTLPSHASIFTGLLPPEHGVRDNLGVRFEAVDEVPYLPRRLKEAGYRTAAMVSTFVLKHTTGLDTGFDVYDDTSDAELRRLDLLRDGSRTLERALAWLDTVPGEEPFFLFFHIYDPHTPYQAPAPFSSRYDDPYDAEVAYSDQIVGRLLERLRELDLYDEALVILLSDHGEGLGDHGEIEHGVFLYRSTQHVPLMVKLPGGARAGTTVARPVGLIDVYPTVLEVLDLAPDERTSGRSLLASDPPSDRVFYAETYYPRVHLGWSELTSVIGERYQYIEAPRPELYDLIADPEQRENLIRTERRVAAELRRELDRHQAPYERPTEVDPETMERLAALGYVGTVADSGDGPRADPKDKVGVLQSLKQAIDHFRDDDHQRANELFAAVLETDPQMVDAWEFYARSLSASGDRERALEAYQEALRLSNGRPKFALSAAEILLELDRLDEAAEHAELAVASDEVGGYYVLGQVALRRGDVDAAERYRDEAEAAGAERPGVLKLDQAIAFERQRYQRSIELSHELEELLAELPDPRLMRGVYFTRARAQLQLGREEAAERSFLAEIDISPDQLAPYTHLALLYALQGRGADTGRILRRMVETNDHPLAYAEAVRTLAYIGDQRSASGLLQQALRRWPDDDELRGLASG